jgi:hypothetical protein
MNFIEDQSYLILPARFPVYVARRASMGAHLRECFLHALSRSFALQIFRYHSQSSYDVIDLSVRHVRLPLGSISFHHGTYRSQNRAGWTSLTARDRSFLFGRRLLTPRALDVRPADRLHVCAGCGIVIGSGGVVLRTGTARDPQAVKHAGVWRGRHSGRSVVEL